MTISAKRIAWITLLLCLFQITSSADSKCSTGTTFACPNCGGFQVSDCLDCTGFLSTDIVHDMCIDRKLFRPHNTNTDDFENHYHYLWNDLVGMVVWFITAGVATACGVGGGGIYVPLGILLFQFAPKQASGLSQASIFGASLGGLFLNSRNRHPNNKIRIDKGVYDEDKRIHVQEEIGQVQEEEYLQKGNKFYTRPLIAYDMALYLAPMEMAGAVLGVLVQKVLPNWLYLLIAGIVLSFTSYKTYKKYFATRATERAKRAEEEAAAEEEGAHGEQEVGKLQDNGEPNTDVALPESGGTDDSSASNSSHSENKSPDVLAEGIVNDEEQIEVDFTMQEQAPAVVSDEDTVSVVDNDEENMSESEKLQLREEYLQDDARQFPREKIVALLILWIGLFLLTLFKGGKGVESLVGISCDSPAYAVLIVLQFAWIFGFAIYFGRKLMIKQAEREAVNYPYLHDDPVWDMKSLRFYGCFTFIAGVVAGLIGIGGGMVLGPLMLVMGIHPRVSSATTATMIVLTSSSVAVIFVTSGLVPVSYAVFYFFVCLVGAYVGKKKIDGYIKRTGRASLLIVILATIIAFATVGCFVILFTRLADKDWCLDGFNEFCTADSKDSCPANRVLKIFTPGGGSEFAS